MSIAIAGAIVSSCAQKNDVALIPVEDFTMEHEGKQVSLYTLKNGDLMMQVTNFGARVVTLWAPDKNGNMEDIVLGYNNIEKYVNNPGERFLGAVVGPYANRIAGGTYTIGDETYNFPQNNNGQTLHGGLKGLDMVVWDVDSVSENAIVLSYVRPDGQDGMPGNLKIVMTYTLTPDNEFKVDYVAHTDKATHVNISHHSFFNLKGEGNGTINDHVLYINASKTTPVNAVLIPSGEIVDVTGTPFDFRQPKAIGTDLGVENEQLANGGGYDHNWCPDGEGYRHIATLYADKSGRTMEVYSDLPGVQFYSGNFLNGEKGKDGVSYIYRGGVALETQFYPDSVNHPEWAQPFVKAGQPYHSTTKYVFSW